MSKYGLHPSKELTSLFKKRPFQGQYPFKAKLIFLGSDANYSEKISNNHFFKYILEYHKDGVSFWKKYGVHHPFLLDDYPFNKNQGGVPYHRNFCKLGLTPKDSDYISFIELVNVPTTGSMGTDISTFWELINIDHLQWIESILLHNSPKVVFVPSGVLKIMQKIKQSHKIFNWLPSNSNTPKGIQEIYDDCGTRIYKTYSFSTYHIHGEIDTLRKIIFEVLKKPGRDADVDIDQNNSGENTRCSHSHSDSQNVKNTDKDGGSDKSTKNPAETNIVKLTYSMPTRRNGGNVCKYCGRKVGLFSNKHVECHKKHEDGVLEILTAIKRFGKNPDHFIKLENFIRKTANNSFIDKNGLDHLKKKGWEEILQLYLSDDRLLTEDEEKKILSLKEVFSLRDEDLGIAYKKLQQVSILRDLIEKSIIHYQSNADINLPFNFLKNEKIIWVFHDIDYYQNKTVRKYVGGSSGVSSRIVKGIYVRSSSFRGHVVEHEENKYMDTGILAFTDKHIYFSGYKRGFRIRFSKITAFQPYSNGFGLQRDAVSARPQIFLTGDGWFVYNLATNLARKLSQ